MRDEKDTFSRSTKEELARVEAKSHQQAFWEIMALRKYLAPRTRKDGESSVPAEPFLMRRLFYLVKQGGGGRNSLASGQPKKTKARIKTAPDSTAQPSTSILLSNVQCRRAFLRGAFLARGSVSSPVRNHHLEIALPTLKDGTMVQSLMSKENLKSGLIRRRSSWVVYLKDADEIAEFLRIVGASQAVLEYENVRARKSLKSSVQRLVNMDRANVSRSVEACIKQVEDIALIDEELGISKLPSALKELARLRLEHPDLSMEELGELLVPKASKSAVNHRFRRIAHIAEDIRKARGGEPQPPAR